MPDLEGLDERQELGDEGLINAFVHQDPVGTHASLPGVAKF